MTTKRNPDPRPFGVPLDELAMVIEQSRLAVSQEGASLIVTNDKLTTRVEAVRPNDQKPGDEPIKAIVTVRTGLPAEVAAFCTRPQAAAMMNGMATLGALTFEGETAYVGSRLTMYEAEDAWNIQFPLLFFATVAGADSLLGAIRRMLGQEGGEKSISAWKGKDFEQVEGYLSRMGFCNASSTGLTAEFGLREEAVSAVTGDHHTALWQLDAEQPHPELGGGLFCLLQMPHQIPDTARLDGILARLNQMEMAPHDLPPHFGAWCRGRLGNNPAYVSFLPNAVHEAHGIAVNVSIWAHARARWANGMLAAMGAAA